MGATIGYWNLQRCLLFYIVNMTGWTKSQFWQNLPTETENGNERSDVLRVKKTR